MTKKAEDSRTLTTWSAATTHLVETVAGKLFRAKSLQSNVSGVIVESLARFAEAAPALNEHDWLDMVQAYEKTYKGVQRRPVMLNAQARDDINTIGKTMSAIREEWPDFPYRQRRKEDTVYSAMPIIVFALLWIQSQSNK